MMAMGLYVGAAIDTYSRFTKKRHSFHWLVACNDLLFWLIQALVIFYVLLQSNNGEVRFYIFLALLCGYAAYQALLQPYYRKLLEGLILLTVRTFRLIVKMISILIVKPIKFILKLIYTLCMMVVTGIIAVIMFAFRLIWKPLGWIGSLFLKWTGLGWLEKKWKLFFNKIKEFARSLLKRKM